MRWHKNTKNPTPGLPPACRLQHSSSWTATRLVPFLKIGMKGSDVEQAVLGVMGTLRTLAIGWRTIRPASAARWPTRSGQRWTASMTSQRYLRRFRAAQVGLVMRSYHGSLIAEDGRQGLTQEQLLRRMRPIDADHAERYSHATVSRWASRGTRPMVRRLVVFGEAFDLSQSETAGLILLAGLSPDLPTALRCCRQDGSEYAVDAGTIQSMSCDAISAPDGVASARPNSQNSMIQHTVRSEFLKFAMLPVIVAGPTQL